MFGGTAAGMGEIDEGVSFYHSNSDAELLDKHREESLEIPDEVPFPIPLPTGCSGRWETYMVMRRTLYNWISVVCGSIFVFCIVMAATIKWTAYEWRGYVGMAVLSLFSIIIAELNRFRRFHDMTAWCYVWRYMLIGTFMVVGLIDFVLLGLSDVPEGCDYNGSESSDKEDCPLLNPDKNGVRIITRTLTTFCGIVFILACFGYWERLAYFSAHSTWVQSLLYMTILGYVFIHVARCAEPPPPPEKREFNWSWHQPHDGQKIGSNIVKIMIFFVLFLVVMGTMVLAIFADVASASSGLGTWIAIFIYFIIAMIISITPLAPGSVIGVCAGFLFMTLFVENEGLGVGPAYGLSLAITICLHFIGSCSQYFVGKMGFVQIWANFALPPEMLAASDSVLKTANWFKVGIVGQVFMDTANGLNQGRMDMAFCTQFWSEYASIPSAITLVGLGAVLAIPNLDGEQAERYQWTNDAIPLMLMMVTLWQMASSTWGAKELLSSAHKPSYWCALEKWNAAQYFKNEQGYVATKVGWQRDVYELAKTSGMNGTCLFDRVAHLQPRLKEKPAGSRLNHGMNFCSFYMKRLCTGPTDPLKSRRRMQESKQKQKEIDRIRLAHFDNITRNLEELASQGFVIKEEKEDEVESFWYNANEDWTKRNLHHVLVLVLFFTGTAAYSWIASDVSLSIAVQRGANVFKDIPWRGWVTFCVFWIVACFYYHKELAHACGQAGDMVRFVFVERLAVNPAWETVFPTPAYEPPKNPLSPKRTHGGSTAAVGASSSDGAAAVAADGDVGPLIVSDTAKSANEGESDGLTYARDTNDKPAVIEMRSADDMEDGADTKPADVSAAAANNDGNNQEENEEEERVESAEP